MNKNNLRYILKIIIITVLYFIKYKYIDIYFINKIEYKRYILLI